MRATWTLLREEGPHEVEVAFDLLSRWSVSLDGALVASGWSPLGVVRAVALPVGGARASAAIASTERGIGFALHEGGRSRPPEALAGVGSRWLYSQGAHPVVSDHGATPTSARLFRAIMIPIAAYVVVALSVLSAIAVWNGSPGFALVCSALLFPYGALIAYPMWKRPAPSGARRVAARVLATCVAVAPLALAGVAAVSLAMPLDPAWAPLDAAPSGADVAAVLAPGGRLVLVSGDEVLVSGDGGRSFARRPCPGAGFIDGIAVDDAGRAVWLGQGDGDGLCTLDLATGAHAPVEARPGVVRDVALPPGRIVLLGDRSIWTRALEGGPWSERRMEPYPHSLARGPGADGARLLVVGSQEWLASDDGGGTFHDVARPADQRAYGWIAAIGGGGWRWAAGESMLGGRVLVSQGEGPWLERTAPARDITAIAASPSDGRTALLGTLGGGVFLTRDAGETWTPLGLERIHVGSLVVDFEGRRVYVVARNLFFGAGLYARGF